MTVRLGGGSRRLTIGLLCLLLGAGAAIAGLVSAARTREATASVASAEHANQPIDQGALRRSDLSAHNSPTITANPTDAANLVIANRIDLPQFGCALHRSADGGATWSATVIPIPTGEEPKCYAPDTAFGADGTLYVTFVTLRGAANEPNAVWLTTSTDGGRTLSTPTPITGPHAYQVRLATDPHTPRRLFVTWVHASTVGNLSFASTGNPIVAVRSDDGGASWSQEATVTPAARQRPIAPSVAIGPAGDVLVLYLDLRDDTLDYEGAHQGLGGDPYDGPWSLVLARSTDGGSTWRETVVENRITPAERLIVFLPPFPSLAIDQSDGRVYAAFEDAREGDSDVYVWSSGDRGASFRPPVRVNDTRRHDGTAQYRPRLAVAPNGRLDVLYYDRRADRGNVMNEVSLQSSFDGGASFGPRVRVSDQAFDSRIGFGSERHLADLGSRIGLLATDSSDLAVWSDTRAGSVASGKQDLGRAVIAFTPSRRGQLLVAGFGAALAAVGALVLLVGTRAGRAPES